VQRPRQRRRSSRLGVPRGASERRAQKCGWGRTDVRRSSRDGIRRGRGGRCVERVAGIGSRIADRGSRTTGGRAMLSSSSSSMMSLSEGGVRARVVWSPTRKRMDGLDDKTGGGGVGWDGGPSGEFVYGRASDGGSWGGVAFQKLFFLADFAFCHGPPRRPMSLGGMLCLSLYIVRGSMMGGGQGCGGRRGVHARRATTRATRGSRMSLRRRSHFVTSAISFSVEGGGSFFLCFARRAWSMSLFRSRPGRVALYGVTT
jgi:hypothetical protein